MAAIVATVLLALIAGSLAAVVLLRDRTPQAGVGSGTPSPTATVTASTEPTPVPSQSGSPSASQPPARLTVDTMARVTTNDLNVRVAANRASASLGHLDAGATTFVMDGPIDGEDGYTWYQIYVAEGPFTPADCDPAGACDINPIGWVAAASATKDAWLEPHAIGCPASPVSTQKMQALTPIERLACFGSVQIDVIGMLDFPCCGYVSDVLFRPAWIAIPNGPFLRDTALTLHFENTGMGIGGMERGDILRVTGHFDDAAAGTCEAYIGDLGDPEETELPDPAWTVLLCRMSFVVDAVARTGHEDPGPCC